MSYKDVSHKSRSVEERELQIDGVHTPSPWYSVKRFSKCCCEGGFSHVIRVHNQLPYVYPRRDAPGGPDFCGFPVDRVPGP